MTLVQKLFGFRGRLRRRDFWVWSIAVGFVSLVVNGLITTTLFPDQTPVAYAMIGDPPALVLASVAVVALFQWPQLALIAKRAHDRNWSAWPFVGIQVAGVALSYFPFSPFAALDGSATTRPTLALTIASLTFLAVWFGQAIVLAFMDGTPGQNRFGPSPKGVRRPAFLEPGGVA